MPLHGCVKQGWRPQSITAGFGKLATVSTKHVSLLPKWPSCRATPISLPRWGRAKNTTTATKMAQKLQAQSYNHTENIHKRTKTTISVAVDLCCCGFLLLAISVAIWLRYCLFLLLASVAVDFCCCWFGCCWLLLLLSYVGVAVDFFGCWFLLFFWLLLLVSVPDMPLWLQEASLLPCDHRLKEGQYVSQIAYNLSYCSDEDNLSMKTMEAFVGRKASSFPSALRNLVFWSFGVLYFRLIESLGVMITPI